MGREYSRSRSSHDILWLWIGAIGGILFLILIIKYTFSGETIDTKRPHLSIIPNSVSSTVFISSSDSNKNRITGTGSQPLYVGDKSVSVENGGASASNTNLSIDMDEKSEISYLSNTGTSDTLKILRGRIWIAQHGGNSKIQMKNLTVSLNDDTIIALEQQSIYSTVYAIHGDAKIETSVGEYMLKPGKKIMVSATDITNPGLQLGTLTEDIDGTIVNTPIFLKNNGKELLASLVEKTPTNSGTSNQSPSISTGNTIGSTLLNFLEPVDGAIIKTPTINIRGTVSSSDIKRITINDKDTLISPVNGTFSFSGFPITGEINNIIYKAYNNDGRILEKGVLTVYGSKQAQNAIKLIPNSSPISSKDFKIVNPTTNPYIMSERSIKVQGTVPKGRVSTIKVNNYQLAKYVPGSTTWYYFANMDAGTLKDGINGYTIEFFGNNNELLYTQIFTLIKESKNATISGETSR